jgi:hypothetical protein
VQNIDEPKQLNRQGLDVYWQEEIPVSFGEGSDERACIDPDDGGFLRQVSTRMICEYVHERWVDNTIPSILVTENVRYGYFTADTLLETFDDPDDRIYRILVTEPIADHIKISVPVHLRLSNIFAGFCMTPRAPMGIEARIALTTPVLVSGNVIDAPFSKAVVNAERLDGKRSRMRCLIGAPYDREDTNYRLNRQEGSLFGFDLETLLKIHLVGCGRDFAADIGDIHITMPK